MSQPSPFGPFPDATPKPGGAAVAAAGGPPIEYLRAYHYIFENPNWMMNLLWGALCLLSTACIPVLGQLVFMGYQYEVVEALFLTRGTRYPDFDTNRFGEYLGRSIWPFLVQLVSSVVLIPVILVGYVLMIALVGGGAAAGGDDFGPVLAMIGLTVGMVIIFAMAIAFTLVMMPMTLRAGLQQDFAAAFDFAWIKDFIARTWLEMVLTTLFLMLSGALVAILGYAALCVGIFAAFPIIMLAQAHIFYQLYALFVSRGGAPIPLKPQPATMAQAYVAQHYVPPQG
jgi:hypothetical protein